MYDVYIAIILLCTPVGGVDVEGSCKVLKDAMGPTMSKVACRERLDGMWRRIEKNTEFLTRTHKELGDFRLSYPAHRGFCLDPKEAEYTQIKKYYDL